MGLDDPDRARLKARHDALRSSVRTQRILRFMGTVADLARSLRGQGLSRSDLLQEGCVALICAIDGAGDDASLAGAVALRIKTRMVEAIRRRRRYAARHVPLILAHGFTAVGGDPYTAFWSVQLEREFRRVLSRLSEFDRAVLELRHGLGGERRCTLDEAGQLLRVNRQRIVRSELLALLRLRRRARRLLPLLRTA